jgi:UDP-glucose 4-epimerase
MTDHPYAPKAKIVRQYKEDERTDGNGVRRFIQVTEFENGHVSRVAVAEQGWPQLPSDTPRET